VFLEYLVKKKLLSIEEALISKIEQIESMPSLIRVIKEDNLVSDEVLYDYLLVSQRENKSIYEILKSRGSLTDSDLEQVIINQNNLSLGLGNILISKGFITKDKFDEALRDYSSNRPEKIVAEGEESPSPVGASLPSSESAGGGGISAAALESLKAINNVDESTLSELEEQVSSDINDEIAAPVDNKAESKEDNLSLDEYFDYYDESLQSELFVVANRYRLKGKLRDLEALHEGILRILTLVKLNDFSVQEKILATYENIMSKVLNNAMELDESWRVLASDMLEVLWEIRKSLFEGHSEANALAQNNIKEKYMNNLKKLIEFTKR